MVAVGRLWEVDCELSYENVVVAAFRLFPSKFGLIGYPDFPDAKRVHDQLFHCFYKSKGWLGGKTRLGFTITELGEAIIRDGARRVKWRLRESGGADAPRNQVPARAA
jgi:hypothetical protein